MLRYAIVILCTSIALPAFSSQPEGDQNDNNKRQNQAIVETILPNQDQLDERFFQEAVTHWKKKKPLEARLYQIEFLTNPQKKSKPPKKT